MNISFKGTKNYKLVIAIICLSYLSFGACKKENNTSLVNSEGGKKHIAADSSLVPKDWTAETHGNEVTPNFEMIFNNNEVKRLDIVIDPKNWNVMLNNMTALYGSFGIGGGRPERPAGRPERFEGKQGKFPGGPDRFEGKPEGFPKENPISVPAQVVFEDKEWYKVGVRFKGNSSLQRSWQMGILKLSLKLNFDEFEDEYPQIKNQRFYGFKKLNLKNNFNDMSMLREKVAADVFKNAGLAVSHTAFYTVYVDHGAGPEYFGLYTLVEEIDDTVISTQFSDNSGNLYKPDGNAASFAQNTFNEGEYEKKNNENNADFTDVKKLLAVIHDPNRTSDPAAWRSKLDSIFDTDVFLKYLAVNTAIQNWDSYGRMTHNYFLYSNPETNKLTWIPWDNNEAMQNGKQGGSLHLDFSNLSTASWPLIGYMYQDEVYKAKYDQYLTEVIEGAFETKSIQSLYIKYAALVKPYATTEVTGFTFLRNSSEFQLAVNQLKSHASQRATAVRNYLR